LREGKICDAVIKEEREAPPTVEREPLKRQTQEPCTNPGIEFSEIYILILRERYYFSLLLCQNILSL
jgi:hypothetical protein